MITGRRASGEPADPISGRQGDKEIATAIPHSDFELRNYQRHDYQKLRRGGQGDTETRSQQAAPSTLHASPVKGGSGDWRVGQRESELPPDPTAI
jgi:hypothetical protein